MAAVVPAMMLKAAQIGFTADKEGAVQINNQHDHVIRLNIYDILPRDVVRNGELLADGKYVPVSTLPDKITAIAEKNDFFQLFTQEHLRRTFTRDISAVECSTSDDEHSLWRELRVDVPFEINKLPGLSVTCNGAVQNIATNGKNIWTGNIFDYSLKRLLLLYLQVTFAANREKRYKELQVKKSKEAEARKEEQRRTLGPGAKWQRRRKERRQVEKCRARVASSSDPEEKIKWQERLDMANLKVSQKIDEDEEMADAQEENNIDETEVETSIVAYMKLGVSSEYATEMTENGVAEVEEAESPNDISAQRGRNSRIRGHRKWGGKQWRRRHRRYVTVALTDEHGTSQTCCCCFLPVTRPKQRVKVKGTWRTRSKKWAVLFVSTAIARHTKMERTQKIGTWRLQLALLLQA